jgi:hypothetical protein
MGYAEAYRLAENTYEFSEQSGNKYIKTLKYFYKFQNSSPYSGIFFPATDTVGLNSVRHQLPFCFLSTYSSFIILQDMKQIFQGSSVPESLGNNILG